MTTIKQAYIDALLADAAYVDVNRGMTVEELTGALSKRMTPTLAAYIAANFEAASSINSSDIPLIGSGFDATVWRGKSGGDFEGQVYVSMRGTEPLPGADLLADGDLAFRRAATSPIIDMVNWWLRATTPTNGLARQLQWNPLYVLNNPVVNVPSFIDDTSVAGTGNLLGVSNVQVDGHSMGGYMASAFARIFGASNGQPGSVNIQGISTFNSAGFNGGNAESLFQEIQALLGTGFGSFAEVIARQGNYFAANGVNVTTNDWWFAQMGNRKGLYQEETTFIGNHSMYRLTDLLAVGAALEKLDSTFTMDKLNELSKVGSSDPKASLESVLDSLRLALEGPGIERVPISDAADSDPSRMTFHAKLAALQASTAYRTLAGSAALRLTAAETADSLAQKAKNDFGWFLAVHALLPIAIEGGGSPLISANPDLYGKWSADRVKRADGSSDLEFTDNYLADRTVMLAWAMKLNTEDRVTSLAVPYTDPLQLGVTPAQYFDDRSSGQKLYLGADNTGGSNETRRRFVFGTDTGYATTGGADELTGGALDDRVYGMSGNDVLQGKGGNDYLEGGRDNDILIGGTGNDIVNGGQGYDSYARSVGDGNDAIFDADKKGRILINGSGVKLLVKNGDAWTSPDNKVTLAQTDSRWKLSIDGGGSMDLGTIFTDGDYGVWRTESAVGGPLLRGDLKPIDFNPSTPEEDIQLDDFGNVEVTITEAPGRNDRLFGRETADTIRGLGGSDILNGKGGHDLMEGGTGSDILVGGTGDDTLWADTPPAADTPLADAFTAGNSASAQGGRGDFLNGQEDNDILIGSAARDFLVGGDGRDLLLGAGGNDLLWGDGIAGDPADNWEFSFTKTLFTINNIGYTYDPAVGQDDALYGGAGDDMLSGLGGDDLLDGGIGNDMLYGGNGKDVLLGGEGNDYLNAQAGDTTGGDWLDGGAGEDEIIGSDMADVTIGGKGNDTIHGGAGRDTYIFNKGDGIDEIWDDDTGPEKSILVFGEGFDKDTIKLRKGSLLLDLGNGDAIHIENFDPDNPLATQSFASFQFADGTSLTWSELLARGFDLDGGDDDDTIIGTGVDDRIDGEAGNDLIWALDGNDVITGGTGTDGLNGGLGNDTYVFNAGDSATFDGTPTGMTETLVDEGGSDTVRFAADVDPANLALIANPDGALAIEYNTVGQPLDRLLIVGGLDGRIEHYEVGAGETARNLNYTQFVGTYGSSLYRGTDTDGYLHLSGGKTADSLYVTERNVVVSGGRGNDTIRVLGDNATILYSIGDGTDHVSTVAYGSPGTPDIPVANVLKLSGVTAADLRLGLGPQGELLLQVGADAADAMLFSTFDWADVRAQRAFDHIEFAPSTSSGQSGTTLGYDELMEKGFDIAGTSEGDLLTGTNVADRITGGAGDDLLQGGSGNDVLDGGAGADTLDGGTGSDSIAGGFGTDSYRLGFGIGQDTVIEAAGESSEIRLDPGITFSNLKAQVSGADAVLNIRNTGDSLRLSDHAGGGWDVVQADGTRMALAELLAQPDPSGEAAVRQVWDDAKLAAFSQVDQDMTAAGWTRSATPGGVGYTSYGPVWLSASEQTTTYEIHHLDTGLTSTSTSTSYNASVSLAEPWNPSWVSAKQVHIYDVRQIQAGEGSTHLDYAAPISASTPRLEQLGLAWGSRMYEQVTRDSGVWLNSPVNGATAWETLTDTWYQAGRVIAATPVADVPADQYGILTENRLTTWIDQTTTTESLVTEVIGTAADEVIDAGGNGDWVLGRNPHVDLADGGAGDDVLYGDGTDVLYGNDGNDQLFGTTGAQTLIGGRGNDFMNGSDGGDVYRVLNEDGVDTVSDTGSNDVTAARYAALGISGAALRYAGQWVLWGGPGDGGVFNSLQEVMDYAAYTGGGWDVDTELANGGLVHYEPLPEWPPLDANDYRQLEALYGTVIATDRVVFAAGVTAQNIRVSGNEELGLMQLDMADGSGLRVDLALNESAIGTGVELFEFTDGTVLTMGDMADRMNADHDIDGTVGDDTLLFGNGADRVRGGAGRDWINSGGGDDVLEGGSGDDFLVGNSGNDVYLYGPGDGKDVIDASGAAPGDVDVVRFAVGIASADVTVSRRAGDLILALPGTDGNITVSGWFDSSTNQARLSAVEFADGTVWDAATLVAASLVMRGTEGIDSLGGTSYGDMLYGLAGDDGIQAGSGDDTLIGGAGDDALWGGSGNDSYTFNRGDGVDRIYQNDAAQGDRDTIRFGADIAPAEVTVGRNGSDLVLTLPDADGSVTVPGWFDSSTSQARLSAVEFADGTVWDEAALAAAAAVIRGTAGNDYLAGTNDGDIFYGLAGEDMIAAGSGDDILIGGAGDDILSGGTGNDIYVFNRGDGADRIYQSDAGLGDRDTIRFGADIAPADVRVGRSGSDLVLTLADADGSVTVHGWFDSGAGQVQLSGVEFADGTVWDAAGLATEAVVIRGTDGDDYLYGMSYGDTLYGLAGADTITADAGDDTLIGGADSDTLSGGSGDDSYVFNRGDGWDRIYQYDAAQGDHDTIRFGAGIDPAEVIIGRSEGDLVLMLGDSGDQVQVVGGLVGHTPSVTFADGTMWEAEALAAAAQANIRGTADGDWLVGTDADETVYGFDGNDEIDAAGGADTLIGGRGDDTLTGGTGNDVYVFNRGDGADRIDQGNAADGDLDVVRFGDGITATDVTVVRNGADLLLLVGDAGDSVRLTGWLNEDASSVRVARVEFADGSAWDSAALALAASSAPILGDDGRYYFAGTEADDLIQGFGGSDTLDGLDGNDTLIGGRGDDILTGGTGNDVYVFNRGDGADQIYNYYESSGDTVVILLGTGIAAADVRFALSGGQFVLSVVDSDDSITIDASLESLPQVQFAPSAGSGQDGTVWDRPALLALVTNTLGTDGDDFLIGTAGNDSITGGIGYDALYGLSGDDILSGDEDGDGLFGGAGNDILIGGAGSDFYAFNRGDGQDVVDQSGATQEDGDVVYFGSGIAPEDVAFSRVGATNDLLLQLAGTTDSLTLRNWYAAEDIPVSAIYFADGTAWDQDALRSKAWVNHAPVGDVTLTGIAIRNQTLTAANTLADADGLGSIGYQWQSSTDGSTWNAIDGATADSFTLTEAQVGQQVRVIAGYTDAHGTAESIASAATVSIANFNNAPTLIYAIGDRSATQDIAFSYAVPDGTFADGDPGDALTFTAAPANGAALPVWLSFDAATRTFSGTPGAGSPGVLALRVTATDSGGLSAQCDFSLSVGQHLHGTGGSDTLNYSASTFVGVPLIDGGAGNDAITGSAGNDIIVGGTGSDNLIGGDGNDAVVISGTDAGYDRFEGGAGFDVLQGNTSDDTFRMYNFSGTATVERIDGSGGNDVIAGTGSSDTLDFSGTELIGIAMIDGGAGNDAITGSAGNDIIVGGTGSDNLIGGDGNDAFLISGTDAGYDRFEGGAGFDVLQGSAGDDTFRMYNFSGTATVEKIDGNGGNDVIAGTGSSDTLDFSATELIGIAMIDGGAGNDGITGSAGNDIIVGGSGTDNLIGGDGNDAFLISGTDAGYDRFEGGAGFDVLQGSAGDDTFRMYNFSLTATVERIDGNGGNNVIAGTGSSDTLDLSATELVGIAMIDGGAGNDAITGSAGNDIIVGGTGSDNLIGGDGDDTFLISGTDAGYDRFEGGAGFDVLQGSAGDDTFRMYNFSLAATVERIGGNGGNDVIAGTGSSDTLDLSSTELVGIAMIDGGAGNDVIVGSAANDVIVGGTGSDNLIGSDGDDTFLISGTDAGYDRFDGGAGYDVIQGSTGDDVIRMYSFRLAATVEKIDGGGGNDILAGTGSSDMLDFSATELAGIALIDGGAGNDAITGSAANDIIVGGSGSDNLRGGDGDDTFLMSGTDAGYDRFDGGAGYDVLQGSAGDDTFRMYTYNGTATVERIDGGGGNDVIAGTGSSDTLNLADTELAGIAMIDGGAGNDVIAGSAGNDLIVGGTGTDRLTGGQGNDTYRIGLGDGADTVVEDDATAGNTDVAEFLAGISADQIWLRHLGNNLEASIIGTADKLTVQNWYLGEQYHVEQFRTADGKLLLDSQVENLVQAMAVFAPPAAGQTTLPPVYQDSLAPLIAANWQ